MTPAGDPRLLSLANGLSDLGGGSPLPQGPSEPATPPPQAPPSLTDLYMKARVAGMDDTNAALAVARHLRDQADLRSGFRDAGNVAAGRPMDLGYRQQLMSEADRPLQDLAARRATGPLAAEEVDRQMKVAGQDIALQQQRGLLDPRHPTNVATRAILAKAGINVPPNTIAPALPKDLWDQIRPLAEQVSKGQEIAALAPGRAAEAESQRATAAKTRALTGPEAAKTTAEAGEIGAKAAVERQKLGIPAPGYEATGQVPRTPENDKELQNRDASQTVIQRNADEVIGLLGGKGDFIASPTKRAKLAAPLGKLMLKLKDEAASRGLPDTELTLFGDILGDPRKISVANIADLAHIKTRLQSFKATAAQDHEAWVASHGYRKTGLQAPGGTTAAATHYLISPDGKSRIAADAQGKPLPGATTEPNPKVPNA